MMMTAVVSALCLSAQAAPKVPYSVGHQIALQRVQGFSVSADHRQVAFELRSTDVAANRGRVDLYAVEIATGKVRQLTTHPENDVSPEWAADGSLYFLSTRSGSAQVWRLPSVGGEAVQVTELPLDVTSFRVGRGSLALTVEVFPDCPDLQCSVSRLADNASQKSTGRLYTQLFVRHWDTWKDGRRSHLFVMPLAGGTPVDVTRRMDADVPPKPFGGRESYTFTPDEKGLVFAARIVGREEAWSTDVDLFVVNLDGKVAPRKLTVENRATDQAPSFSPDGQWLAYLAASRPGYESDQNRVVLYKWPSGPARVVAKSWDRSVDSFGWARGSDRLFVTADHLGQKSLFALNIGSDAVLPIVETGFVDAIEVAGDDVVYTYNTLSAPTDIYVVTPGGDAKPRRLTAVNDAALSKIAFGDYEQFSFAGYGDETVFGYIVKPVGFDPTRKYPLAFLVHGGPQGSFGNHFHYRWNPQVYAGAGYVAVMVDFHGSTGYGQAFTDSIRGDWGGKPLEDLQKGLAAVLGQYPFIDRSRACALGASYGGYMMNWMAGVWNEPFRCFVTHDGNLDERFAYFDTEELWFPEWEHGGTPWDNPAGYTKHNPIDHVGQWSKPMLVIHGGKDFRVVDTQGISTFTVLQRRNIPSQFLYFPDENHWVLKPANSVLWHETVLKWLDRWTRVK